MVTLRELAAHLHLSASTVSRALSGSHKVSRATTKRVQMLATKLDYQPNTVASSLRKGYSKTLGVIIPHIDNNFFGRVLTGIEETAGQAGYRLMVCRSNDDAAREKKNVEMLLHAQVAGIMLSQARTTYEFSPLEAIRRQRVPLVFFDRFLEGSQSSAAIIDDRAGGYEATRHLLAQGYRRIAHLAGPQQLNIYKNRQLGYEQALREAGISVDEALVLVSPLRLEDGIASMKQLLTLSHPPDAVFCASDFAAIGSLQVLKAAGVRVPAEVGVVGFSNELFAQFTEPALTSVDQHGEAMGQSATWLLLQLIGKGQQLLATQYLTLQPTLCARTSSLRQEL